MNQMNDATKHSILRWIHIVFGIPILGYIYSPFEEIPNYAPAVRFCLPSCNCRFGILDVERPSPYTTYFEKIGLIGVNSSHDTAIKGNLYERRGNKKGIVTGTT
jgi:hypothetical protein